MAGTMKTARLRGANPSARPFYLTIFLISLFAAYSFLVHIYRGDVFDGYDGSQDGAAVLGKRSSKPECIDVHQAKDKCAFVKEVCTDADAGLIPYLQFYYCGMPHAQGISFIILLAWLGLLFTTIGIAASDFFSINLSTIATILGLSESLAGVTFLAFGNGSPDVFSTFAAMNSNSASMAVGELIGAASFITGVVAGSMALVREFKVDKRTYARDICFFIVAVAFTMVFLADGHLRFFECWIMIGYYVVYVVAVVAQHWYQERRKRRLRREGEARSHVYGSVGAYADELAGEPYRDDPDDVGDAGADRRGSVSAIAALEHGPRIEVEGRPAPSDSDLDEESDEEHNRQIAAEVASSMRVLRTRGKRSNTINPIRPSLVGALEFRSALAQLQKESNLKLSTMHGPGRSLSEAHLPSRGRRRTTTDAPTDMSKTTPLTAAQQGKDHHGRSRALSSGNEPTYTTLPPELLASKGPARPPQTETSTGGSSQRSMSPTPSMGTYTIGGNLAPPPAGLGPPSTGSVSPLSGAPPAAPTTPGSLHLQIPSRRSSQSGGSSPVSPFPMYTDSPAVLTPHPHMEHGGFMLPAPVQREASFPGWQTPVLTPRPVRWWPYSALPPPHVLLATLFPTLQGWREKTIWDKIVSLISVPSIFLLVITLPVVESETTEEEEEIGQAVDMPHSHCSIVGHVAPSVSVEPQAIEHESEWQRYRRHTLVRNDSYQSIAGSAPTTPLLQGETDATRRAVPNETYMDGPSPHVPQVVSQAPSSIHANDETMSWNRWLVCLQLFTGPLFSVFVLWANLLEDFERPGKALLTMVLYTLLVSTMILGVLLLFTSEQRKPKYHYFLCFLGFVISIAWISTIAGEVVGVLKTFGVVLDISEALLGLTIFAAGNSVGDLIADITVARLGYPVMALSACFGGPMLNILLGIGIGGVIMMVQKANKKQKKHPGKLVKYGPYPIQVGGTLMVSAITLLVILVGLLIAVPMNKWVLSRKIGWILIALWCVSTVVNVVVELTGVWGDVA